MKRVKTKLKSKKKTKNQEKPEVKLTLKSRKRKAILFSVIGGVFVVCAITVAVVLSLLARINYHLVDSPKYEVNTENTVSSLFSEISAGTINDAEALLDTSAIGEKYQSITLTSQLGTTKTIEVAYEVEDTTSPSIEGEGELSFEAGTETDLLSHYHAEDNSKQDAELSVEGDYDLGTAGEYNINIVAKDASGNETKKPVTLKITAPPRATVAKSSAPNASGSPYYIEVNRQQNVVIVYSKDQSGSYSNIAKVFVASTGAPGSETPLGTFTTSDKYETLYLVGNVWGHYTTRISGPYYFHSVPYFTKGNPSWDNLEYLEYNKLGNGASAGCVRLAAIDAKWIFDNIPRGTTVKIYDSPSLPQGVTKPTSITIDANSPNRGWDPTDPDPNNAWR